MTVTAPQSPGPPSARPIGTVRYASLRTGLVFGLMLFALVAVFGAALVAMEARAGYAGIWEILSFAMIGAISITMFAYCIARDGISLRSIFFFFCVFFFFLVPSLSYANQLWKYRVQYDQVLFVNLCVLAFILIYIAAHSFAARRARDRYRAQANVRHAYVVQFWPMALCFVGAVLFAATIIALVGWQYFALRAYSSSLKLPLPLYIIVHLMMRPGVFVLLLVAIYWYKSSPRVGMTQRMLIFMIGLVAIAVNFPTSTARFYAFTLYLSLLFVVYPPRPQRALMYGGLLLGALFGSALLDVFRTAIVDFASARLNVTYLFVGHFDAYEVFLIGYEYVAAFGVQWGRQLAAVLFFWVPRAIWSGKPIATGTEVSREYLSSQIDGDFNANISSPLPMEGFVDFGVAGVIFYAVAFGLGSGYLDGRFGSILWPLYSLRGRALKLALRQTNPDAIIAYPILVAMSLMWLRGGLNFAFSTTCGMIAAYIVIKRLCIRTVRIDESRAQSGP